MSIEEQIVDLVFDAQGELTLNQLCSIGVRERLAEAIEGDLDKILSEWFDKKVAKDMESWGP